MERETPTPHLFNFEDLQNQAETYLSAVREKAREIIEGATLEMKLRQDRLLAEADAIREKARHEGYQEGVRLGALEVESKIQEELQRRLQQEVGNAVDLSRKEMATLLEQCASLREEITRNWENTFLRLVFRVAKTVIRRELKQEPQISVQWVREALELSLGESSLVLILNPEDATLMKTPLERLFSEFRQLGEIEIRTDTTLARGDCILQSENGRLDQRLDSQLARIEEELCA